MNGINGGGETRGRLKFCCGKNKVHHLVWRPNWRHLVCNL